MNAPAIFLVSIVCLLARSALAIEPLPQAHAHNDYEHDRPLLDALDHGFCSVEADVFPIDDELRVAHFRAGTRKGRTLKKLYFDPLSKRIEKNKGSVYEQALQFTLLIDFKADGEKCYELLKQSLQNYPEFAQRKHGSTLPAISIVISGARPIASIREDPKRICGIDGRIADLESQFTAEEMPMISDKWGSHFRWRGNGEFPEKERDKLREIVNKAHAAGRRVRFWATPESERVWQELVDAKVDHINTDKLASLRKFLLGRMVGQGAIKK